MIFPYEYYQMCVWERLLKQPFNHFHVFSAAYDLRRSSAPLIEATSHGNKVTEVNWLAVSGDPLELPQEAPGEEQARGVLQEPLLDLPGVRREPAETRAVRLPQSGQPGERAGERRSWSPQLVFTFCSSSSSSSERNH